MIKTISIAILSIFTYLIVAFPVACAQDYAVGAGDVLKIKVYDNADLDTTARVSGGGTIIMPLIGKVRVKGLAVMEISDRIASIFADGYLKNPQVNVFVEEYRGQNVTILGQVNQPGLFELQGNITLLELISKAGGLTKDAGRNATIKRNRGGGDSEDEYQIEIDLDALIKRGDISKNVKLMDGDSIFIDEVGQFFVSGAVVRPNAYRFQENLTVLKAITLSGGFAARADKNNIKISRKEGERQIVLENVGTDQIVYENDIIVVPKSFF